ncbi:MAG: hypothetical protein RLZZ32_680 [Cyanobacteriota bacterium]
MRVHWGWDDLRIVGDIVLGSLLAGGLRLVVMKAFLEPAAMFLGQRAYRQADKALGDRLPDFFGKEP